MIREMRRLLKFTGHGWQFACLLMLRAPFDIGSTIVQATFLQRALDAVEQADTAGIASACMAMGIASLCLYLYNGTVWSIYAPFVTRMEGVVRMKLYRRIASFTCERIESVPQGEWLTLLNTDVEMPFSRPLHLPHAVCALANIGVSAVILWRMNPHVFGWVMLFVIPHIAVSQFLIARAMPGLQKKSLEAKAGNTGELTALITCADAIALYEAQACLMRRFEQSSLNVLHANTKVHARKALASGILPLFGLGGYLTLLAVSSRAIADGLYTFGGLTAAFQYRGGVLVGSLMLINSLISIEASMAGIRRLNTVLSQ